MSELEAAVNVVQVQKMPALIEQYNEIRSSILSNLKTYKEIVPQKLNDAEGGAGYMVRFFPETTDLGRKIAAALNAEGIGIGRFIWPAECDIRGEDAPPDWHIYKNMFAVLQQIDPADSGCPFSCATYQERGGKIDYQEVHCPVADDLFNRNIQIWFDPSYDEEDCRNIAAGINKVLSAYCTEDESGQKWI
jgi:dTDP-4-amino-4,6-dideoxygalactose transaminase